MLVGDPKIQPGALLVLHERTMVEVVSADANGVVAFNVANSYRVRLDADDIEQARLIVPDPDPTIAGLEAAAAAVQSPQDAPMFNTAAEALAYYRAREDLPDLPDND